MRVGIFGGGQLARMTMQAAIDLGIEVVIFERHADSPAGRLTQHEIVGAWDDPQALARFATTCDLATLESEFVDAAILRQCEALGTPVFPSPATVATVQDKYIQKRAFAKAGLAVPLFRAVATPEEVAQTGAEWGWPLLLKARRDGYDGYGNVTIGGPEAIAEGFATLGAAQGRALLVEQFIPFQRELAVMVARNRRGEVAVYPVVETEQANHICHVVRAPAALEAATEHAAAALAVAAVEAIEGVGVFGVEMFELRGGLLLINEIAPRPHNSGHYTIEACATSQFANHLRAILDWPLGSTAMRAPAAVMVNLLGRRSGPAESRLLRPALAVEGAQIHLYGKRDSRLGRKMGHVTVLGASLAEAEATARRAADAIEI